MTLREPPSLRTPSARSLLVLDDTAFHPLPFPAEGYRATRVLGWDALHTAVRRAPPSTAVLVAPFSASSGAPDPRLRELLSAAPLLPVLVAVNLAASDPADVRVLLEWGVSEVLDVRLEGGPEALVPRFRAAHARPFKRRLEAGLSRYLSPNAMTLVRAAAGVACDCGLSAELAAVFAVNERTVGKWCAAEGLPPPRRLLAWVRVLLGVALLEEGTRSWNNAARSTGYVDASGLRRAVAGFLHPRQTGADERRPSFQTALAAFDGELHQRRERRRGTHGLRRPRAR
jgi:hypothetical protein